MPSSPRRPATCPRCGGRLARDNTTGRCAPCEAAERDRLVTPPKLPADFWDHEPIRQAAAERHFGRLLRAYRNHPYHGRHSLPQETVGRWLGITQAQMSRLENGRPVVHLDRLTHWAQIIGIPAHLLWFKLPDEQMDDDKSSGNSEVTRRTLLAAGGLAIATTHGLLPANPANPSSDQLDALADLRAVLSSYIAARHVEADAPTLSQVARDTARAHSLYQQAHYRAAARLLPGVISNAMALAESDPRSQQITVFKVLAMAYIAASKLAGKLADRDVALLTADRAAAAARLADDRALSAVAAYQVACALALSPNKLDQAARVVHTSLEDLKPSRFGDDPDLISAAGSLLLLAALIAAQQKHTHDASRYLARADQLAGTLGSDQNRLWTGFGPTNVAIHEVSAAVKSDQPDRAIEIGSDLNTSRLPAALLGRRAQVHLDLAAASATKPDGKALAVLHLAEAERVAPEVLRFNTRCRSLLADLLNQERRHKTPGLRPMAMRAGLLA